MTQLPINRSIIANSMKRPSDFANSLRSLFVCTYAVLTQMAVAVWQFIGAKQQGLPTRESRNTH